MNIGHLKSQINEKDSNDFIKFPKPICYSIPIVNVLNGKLLMKTGKDYYFLRFTGYNVKDVSNFYNELNLTGNLKDFKSNTEEDYKYLIDIQQHNGINLKLRQNEYLRFNSKHLDKFTVLTEVEFKNDISHIEKELKRI